ncbi:diguanylate cyclase (GGDEF)-like protein [Thiogranum longum]|uniref:diguanylate cyclase n=1 Tax=Thiogranum longum TaxID=1537524 RepID=A0A4R1H8Q4_9GAMM|nr:sensor domain-containing diguanylate cyclase [Thiogranum longum]TCK16823.1 diguanylate cyclase (GGDEF)-like protein [Thiogranum longum]
MPEYLSPEQALRLIETCPIPLLVLDHTGIVHSYNPAFAVLAGKTRAEALTGKSARSIGNTSLKVLLATGAPISWPDSNGQPRHYEIHCCNIDGPDTLEIRYFIDITRQRALQDSHCALREELRENTLTDPVTGLLNQRGVILALEPQVARSRRYNSPISVISLDVYRVSEDDTLRKQVALQLKDQLRWADLIGCDENHAFLLILPETGEDDACRLAEKLRTRLVEFLQVTSAKQQISIFYGVTGWQRTDNAATLLRRAGRALEQSRSGQETQPVAS